MHFLFFFFFSGDQLCSFILCKSVDYFFQKFGGDPTSNSRQKCELFNVECHVVYFTSFQMGQGK